MASSQDYSSSPDDARMEIDLEARSEEDVGNRDGGSQNEMDFGNQYSPTNPTENSPVDSFHIGRSRSPNRYSPTSPTDDIDYLEDIVSRTDRLEPDDRSMPDNDGGGSADDNPVGVLEVDDDNDNDDSDAENRLVIQEDPGEEVEEKEETVEGKNEEISDVGSKDKVEKEGDEEEISDVGSKDKVEKESDENSQGLASTQEPVGQLEVTDTFLDNLNPQDDSQGAGDREIEEEEAEKRSDDEQMMEKSSCVDEDSFAREEKASAMEEKEDASLLREEEEESSPAEEEKEEASSSREEEEGEVQVSSSPGLHSPGSEPGDNQDH